MIPERYRRIAGAVLAASLLVTVANGLLLTGVFFASAVFGYLLIAGYVGAPVAGYYVAEYTEVDLRTVGWFVAGTVAAALVVEPVLSRLPLGEPSLPVLLSVRAVALAAALLAGAGVAGWRARGRPGT